MVKVQIGKFTDFLKSGEVVTVASALLITPVILGTVSSFGANLPVIGDRIWIIFLIASIVIFSVASMFTGLIKNILLGLSVGLAINSFLSTQFGAQLVSRFIRT